MTKTIFCNISDNLLTLSLGGVQLFNNGKNCSLFQTSLSLVCHSVSATTTTTITTTATKITTTTKTVKP